MKSDLVQILKQNRIIPVTVFDTIDDALRTADLLAANSFHIIEITLRTKSSMESIRRIGENFPGIIMGAGSVLSRDSLKEAFDCGIQFAVSPAFDPELVDYSGSLGIPFIPGAATPTELNSARTRCPMVKIFPASGLGGPKYIRSMSAPFAMEELNLIPTGGITDENYLEYLAIDRVIACGMTYMTDRGLLRNGDFGEMERRMKRIRSGLGAL